MQEVFDRSGRENGCWYTADYYVIYLLELGFSICNRPWVSKNDREVLPIATNLITTLTFKPVLTKEHNYAISNISSSCLH